MWAVSALGPLEFSPGSAGTGTVVVTLALAQAALTVISTPRRVGGGFRSVNEASKPATVGSVPPRRPMILGGPP